MLILLGISPLLTLGCARRPPASPAEAAARFLSAPAPERGFISKARAKNWEEALISGNGTMGALVMGDPLAETITLSRAGLFMPIHEPLPPVGQGFSLNAIRTMLLTGRYQEASEFVVKQAVQEGYDGKRWTDPFIPAFDLRLSMPAQGAAQDYRRTVDFQTGVASVGWRDERGPVLRRLFVSRPDNVVVLSLAGARPGAVDCRLGLAQRPPDRLARASISSVKTTTKGGWMTFRCGFSQRWPGSLEGYEGVARVITKGGMTLASGGGVAVSGADEVLVLLRIELVKDFTRTKILRMQAAFDELPADFDALLARHAPVHGEIYNRVRLDLGGGKDRQRTSEELLATTHSGALSPALLEKEFDAGRYAILSSSGEGFPTLQGIWSATYNPRWSGDYTMNGNVPCALSANLDGNMAELMEPYFKYLEAQMKDYRANARRLFNCRGIFVPSRASSHGLNNHFDATWPMTFWTAGAGWAAHFYYDYYLHTGDREFLKRRALPFMKEAAAFYEDFLFPGEGGKWVFAPSYSPENNPGNQKSQACINATMDVAVARELLGNLVAACNELSTETESVKRWQEMLAKMPDYQINKDGAVKEWLTPKLEDNYAHRHCSHFYALFDGAPAEITSNTQLRAAFKRAAELRMAERRKENGGIMAFGLVQLAQAAASLHDAPLAYEALEWLGRNYWQPNMVSTHNPKSVFNVDLCGGLPALVIRMLMQSSPGELDLLPALPQAWPKGRIEGLRARGQILIKTLEWNGANVNVALRSDTAQKVKITVEGGIENIKVKGEGAQVGEGDEKGYIVELPAGSDVTVKIRRTLTEPQG